MIGRLMTSMISFIGSMLAAINLNFLLEPITDYDPRWWKVIVCICMAAILPIIDNYMEGR